MNAKLRKKCKVSKYISSKCQTAQTQSQTPSSNQTEKSRLQLSIKIQKVQFTVKMPKSPPKLSKKRGLGKDIKRRKVQKLSKEKIKYAEESYASKQDTFFSSFPNKWPLSELKVQKRNIF